MDNANIKLWCLQELLESHEKVHDLVDNTDEKEAKKLIKESISSASIAKVQGVPFALPDSRSYQLETAKEVYVGHPVGELDLGLP